MCDQEVQAIGELLRASLFLVNPTRYNHRTCLLGHCIPAYAHPLRLSLSEIEYNSDQELITEESDFNGRQVPFHPQARELAFTLPHESPAAERLLLNYVNRLFYVKVPERKSISKSNARDLVVKVTTLPLAYSSNIDKNSLLTPRNQERCLHRPVF